MKGTNRRFDLEQNTPEELAIHDAMVKIENMGADEKLTNAITLLDQAKNLVSDYIDENL